MKIMNLQKRRRLKNLAISDRVEHWIQRARLIIETSRVEDLVMLEASEETTEDSKVEDSVMAISEETTEDSKVEDSVMAILEEKTELFRVEEMMVASKINIGILAVI